MRDLSDMNDLYNFQDNCLLCEIVENRFEVLHKMYPRNWASALSGCIERDMLKVILALPRSTGNV